MPKKKRPQENPAKDKATASKATASGGKNHPESSPRHGRPSEPQIEAEPKSPFPAQHQPKPGIEARLNPLPAYYGTRYKPAGKLTDKVALITGGDSGIGRSVAVLFAREGADVIINYLPEEQEDADEVQRVVRGEGRKCVLAPGDLTDAEFCKSLVEQTIHEFGKLDILVSNAAHQNRKPSLEAVTDEEFDRTLKTNIYAYFWLTRAALPHLKPGASIIVTSSQTGVLGSKNLYDYSATKGAINAFTKALAQDLADKGIRVNAVAPGPVWTPLNAADEGMTPENVAKFGAKTPMKRPAQPEEIAPAYVFLASDADSSFVTGIILQEMGGETAGG